jgi:hypothetical protein
LKDFDKTCRIDEKSRMKKQHVQLSQTDRESLEALISKGEQTAKAYRRTPALLQWDRGPTYSNVFRTLQSNHSDFIWLGNEVPCKRITSFARSASFRATHPNRWYPTGQGNYLGLQCAVRICPVELAAVS